MDKLILYAVMHALANNEDAYRNKTRNLLPKIVGGNVVSIKEFPYQVSVRMYGQHICGGSLIGHYHVLTAGHCVEKYKKDLRYMGVAMGHTSLKERQTVYKADSAVVHPDYENLSEYVLNDLAIIKLSTGAPVDNETVKIIGLGTRSPEQGRMCTVSGWGATEEADPLGGPTQLSDILRAVDVPIIDYRTCSLKTNQTEGVFCAGYKFGGKDSCQGDSGGPLVCDNTLYGVVSWGNGCARLFNPGVYTDVSLYSEWIQNNSLALPVHRLSSFVALHAVLVHLYWIV